MFGWTTFFIRLGTCIEKLLGFHYAPLVADLILFCYERDLMMSLSDDKQSDIIKGFNIWTICPSELQLNKANTSDTKAAF